MRSFSRSTILAAVSLAALSAPAATQSVLERTPNLSGGWLGDRGTLQFNFLHRFSVGDPPERKVNNSPTFFFSYRLPFPLLLGANFATSSDVAGPQKPNEWEMFGRYAPLAGKSGNPLDVAVQVGYNEAAQSVDGELGLSRRIGRLRLLAVGRAFSSGYAADTARYAVGGGATLQLGRHVALAADVATLIDRRSGEEVAWGAALQLAIPYTPHSFSLQVTNTNTGTLQGVSRGIDNVRGGFEFTIPFTFARYFRRPPPPPVAAGARQEAGTRVEMRQLAFTPSRIEVAVGTTVEWTNGDLVEHTITANDGSWDSGPVAPGATWRRRFDSPGTFSFHCTPHPMMTGVVVVQ